LGTVYSFVFPSINPIKQYLQAMHYLRRQVELLREVKNIDAMEETEIMLLV
jgi:hypothetical protein